MEATSQVSSAMLPIYVFLRLPQELGTVTIPASGSVEGTVIIEEPVLTKTITTYLTSGTNYVSTITSKGGADATVIDGIRVKTTTITTQISGLTVVGGVTITEKVTGPIETVLVEEPIVGTKTITSYLTAGTGYTSTHTANGEVSGTVVIGEREAIHTTTTFLGTRSGYTSTNYYATDETVVVGYHQSYVTVSTYGSSVRSEVLLHMLV